MTSTIKLEMETRACRIKAELALNRIKTAHRSINETIAELSKDLEMLIYHRREYRRQMERQDREWRRSLLSRLKEDACQTTITRFLK